MLIPAHNEEKYIVKCLNSIVAASEKVSKQVEVIVILMLSKIENHLVKGTYIGEGVSARFERISSGIIVSTIKKAHMIISCRKSGHAGDWILVRRPQLILAYLRGTDQRYANEAYYENQKR